MKEIREKIFNEITSFCENCVSRECCCEEECVLFRIEKLVEEVRKENILDTYNEIKNKFSDVSFSDLHIVDVVLRDIEGSNLDFNEVYSLCHDVWIHDITGLSINLIVDYITEYYESVKDLNILDIIDLINEV